MKQENRIIKMIMDSDTVYVDGMTIKDRENLETHPNVNEVMKNIDNYFITSFNRDSKKGKRYLELRSEYVL
jgi:spore coat polysaccharide biosynthesis predicted glycosyltransferase SpsG